MTTQSKTVLPLTRNQSETQGKTNSPEPEHSHIISWFRWIPLLICKVRDNLKTPQGLKQQHIFVNITCLAVQSRLPTLSYRNMPFKK